MNSSFGRGLLILIIVLGAGLRIASFSWNQYIHGDVGQYSVAVESLATRGDFLIDADTTKPHFYSLEKTSGRFLEHNPLWPLWGSVIVKIFGIPGFTSLKILSLISGIALLYFVFMLGSRVLDQRLGLFALALSAASYLLIDFSTNGSFYIFQALLYVIFVLALLTEHSRYRSISLGCIMGAGLLLNQQTIVLVFSYLVYEFFIDWKGKHVFIKNLFSVLSIPFVFYFLWAFRNYVLFGSPSPEMDLAYVWGKLGLSPTTSNGIISYSITSTAFILLGKKIVSFWLPHNLYFINRKLFVEAPLVYIFSLFTIVEILVSKFSLRFKKLYPALILLCFHVLISAAWPIAKFRYLVPVMPLIFLLGGYYVFEFVKSSKKQKLLIAGSLFFLILVSGMIYVSNPIHTHYYDGAITTDNFGKQGELEFIYSQKNPEL